MKSKELEEIFCEHGAVEFFLSEKKSRALGKTIRAWQRLSRHRRYPFIIRNIVKAYYLISWFIISKIYMVPHPEVAEIIIFYAKFKGPRNIFIEAEQITLNGVKGKKINMYKRS